MLKKILIAVLMAPLVALAQSYPSPTYQNLTVLGTLTASIPLASLPSQSANTVLANATSSSHTPTAVTIAGCNGAAQALQYTNGSGFGCNSNVATSGANSNITSLSALSTPLSVGQGGTGATSAASALTNLGAASIGANTFTAAQTIGFGGVVSFTLNDTAGTNQTRLNFSNTGNLEWGLINASSTNQFSLNRYNAGTLVDTVFLISNSTGIVSMPDGMTAAGGINSTAIGNTTPAAGKFTTLQATSTITPSSTAGIVGTTTNDNANAGSVGEYICAQVTNGGSPTGCQSNVSTPVPLTANTAANVTSISLGAGDWDIRGEVITIPNASTTISVVSGWISLASAAIPTGAAQGLPWTFLSLPFTTGQGTAISLSPIRVSLSTTTTVYLSAFSTFGTSTMSAYGWIQARRVR